jgi:hypothetical protein
MHRNSKTPIYKIINRKQRIKRPSSYTIYSHFTYPMQYWPNGNDYADKYNKYADAAYAFVLTKHTCSVPLFPHDLIQNAEAFGVNSSTHYA